MRDLLFKNLTSNDKKRRVLVTSETTEKEGVRSTVHRHFVYIVREVKDKSSVEKHTPYIYVLKERNNKEQREKFFCRMKGRAYVVSKGKLYLILFMHSLKIILVAASNQAAY